MGLLLLTTIAYLPLVAVVVLNLIMPAQRELEAAAHQRAPDEDASRDALRRTFFGVGLLACLTLGQCGVLAYSVYNLKFASVDDQPGLILARQSD